MNDKQLRITAFGFTHSVRRNFDDRTFDVASNWLSSYDTTSGYSNSNLNAYEETRSFSRTFLQDENITRNNSTII